MAKIIMNILIIRNMTGMYILSRKRSLNIKGDHRLIVTQFVCPDIFLFFIFLFLFHKTNFLVDKLFFLCKKWVKIVDNVDNFVNNSIFPHIFLPQNVDNYSHLSLIFDISTNINSFVCAICTIYPLSIIFFRKQIGLFYPQIV